MKGNKLYWSAKLNFVLKICFDLTNDLHVIVSGDVPVKVLLMVLLWFFIFVFRLFRWFHFGRFCGGLTRFGGFVLLFETNKHVFEKACQQRLNEEQNFVLHSVKTTKKVKPPKQRKTKIKNQSKTTSERKTEFS